MPRDADGNWIPQLSPKQIDVMNSRARALLVHGPRISGKSRGVLHRIARHLWELDRSRVGFFAKTLKSTKDGGTWNLLTKPGNGILSEWIASGIGFRYTTKTGQEYGVKTDNITRTPYFRVSNCHGTESECLLFSIDNDKEVEQKLKELEFSMIYFSEVDKFGSREVLTIALPSLRLSHIRYEDQIWVGDCNPAEEGDQSWVYQVFFRERLMSYDEYVDYQRSEDRVPLPEADFRAFYGRMDAVQILPSDNPWVDARQLQDIRVSCGSDQGLYARHVLGEWVWGGGDASRHFRSLWGDGFRFLVGHTEGPEEDWEYAAPTPNCFELVTGWDPGDTNHASVLLEKYLDLNTGKTHFVLLDELVYIGEEVGLEEFTEEFMEKVESIEKTSGKTFNLDRAWADRSVQNFNATGNTYPAAQVLDASKGRITLQGVPKPHTSVRARVNLLKQLLREGRIHVSAHCKHAIQMFRDLKRGKDAKEFVVADGHSPKHVFDALTYAILAECAEDSASGPSVGKRITNYIAAQIG